MSVHAIFFIYVSFLTNILNKKAQHLYIFFVEQITHSGIIFTVLFREVKRQLLYQGIQGPIQLNISWALEKTVLQNRLV